MVPRSPLRAMPRTILPRIVEAAGPGVSVTEVPREAFIPLCSWCHDEPVMEAICAVSWYRPEHTRDGYTVCCHDPRCVDRAVSAALEDAHPEQVLIEIMI